ncbi:MAG: UDP-N-acetylmuramoyl-L-alanyl-D-glutamate--2,6-diaminopimelate ligase [Pseudomonadota bacterium]
MRHLTADSRLVGPGALFAGLRGVAAHGADFAPQALEKGAAAVLTDLEGALRIRAELGGWPAPILVVAEPRRVWAEVAARFFAAQPDTLVAVTGTNGKTSVAAFTAQIWAALDHVCAALGTTGVATHNLPEGRWSETLAHTTPEPVALQGVLSRLAAAGVTHAAMEASSHGLAQHRLAGARLAAGAFTNLSRDHLDYHRDAHDYAAAKLSLFAERVVEAGAAVINADDPLYPAARDIARARGLDVISYGRAAEAGGLRLLAQDAHMGGQRLRIGWGEETRVIELPLVGAFQGWNALAAAGLAVAAGADAGAALDALAGLKGVRGRMELVARRANGAGVFVDYAHTPDALAVALAAIRPHTPGRVHVAFGAGGDRYPGKRPLMGAAAATGADVVVVTDDNPRTEDPAEIRAQILAGAPGAAEIGDRAEAILRAVDALEAGDALLLAGKGHETGQTVGAETYPFDDAEQARASAAALDGEDATLYGV